MKKILLLTLTCILCFSACNKDEIPSNGDLYGNNPDAFITIWKTDNLGSTEDNQIKIPGYGTDYNIFWEEIGNPTNNGLEQATDTHTITFPKNGVYKISISGGTLAFNRIHFGMSSDTDAKKLIYIEQWGRIEWSSFANAFSQCKNLEVNANDIPDLKNVTNMKFMFFRVKEINGDVTSWDVSNVTNLTALFTYCKNFNQDVSRWDVSNVIYMGAVFHGCENFNQDISSWDVSSVKHMDSMFASTNFNQDISGWDVSNVTSMYWMFGGTKNFKQDISGWDVSNVTNMTYLFYDSNFNQNISSWDVSNVTTMSGMFLGNEDFNQDISSWDVSNVASMGWMFGRAKEFNQDISNWNVSNITDMENMFHGAENFNQNISDWNVSNVNECVDFSKNSGLNPAYLPSLPAGCD
ncbi:MAG: surface protein [Polaribacter sp.]|jgi:surface protein